MKEEHLEKYKLELKDLSLQSNKVFKKINCPSCNSSIPADNININDKIAKCNSCDVVFPFQEEISDLIETKNLKQEVIRPEGIDIFYYKDDLDITIQQPFTGFDFLHLFLSPIIFFILLAIFSKGNISFYWPLVSFVVMIFSFLSLSFRSKHKVYITVDEKNLTIKWRPKKFFKDKQYKVEEIDQIYVINSADGTGMSVMMIVNGINGQKHITLISGLTSISKARYLEQEIEHYLGIEDRRIPEESI